MSFRNTFVTDFIYQASDEVRESNRDVAAVFQRWCGSTLAAQVDERGYGYYSGWFKTLSGTLHEAQEDLRQIIPELEKATKAPFRLTILLESEAQLTYLIKPSLTTPKEEIE